MVLGGVFKLVLAWPEKKKGIRNIKQIAVLGTRLGTYMEHSPGFRVWGLWFEDHGLRNPSCSLAFWPW